MIQNESGWRNLRLCLSYYGEMCRRRGRTENAKHFYMNKSTLINLRALSFPDTGNDFNFTQRIFFDYVAIIAKSANRNGSNRIS